MHSVLVAGAFGQGNPGDEGHLRAAIDHLDGWRVVATSADQTQTARDHGCATVSSRDPREVAREVSRADAVVFAGGTIFKLLHTSSERPPHDLLRRGLLLATGARLLDKPVAMLGVGAGHLEGRFADMLVRALARRASLLVLRDEESASLLARAGVRPPFRIGTDPAWSLFTDPPPDAERTDDVVVALSHLAGPDDALVPYLEAALRPLVAAGVPIKLQPWQSGATDDDVRLARRLADLTGADVIDPPADLPAARDLYASCALVIGLRFHASMAAAAASTPFVVFGHEPKLVAIARRFGQPCVAPMDHPASFAETVLGTIGKPPPPMLVAEHEVATAQEGFQLLRLLIDAPGSSEPEHVEGLELTTSRFRSRGDGG